MGRMFSLKLLNSQVSKWMVGSNSSLNLWYDKWLAVGSIRSLIVGPLPRKLCYFEMLEMGELGPIGLLFCVPSQFFHYRLKFHVPLCSSCDDIIAWASSSKGSFESKNAYLLSNGTSNNNPSLSRKSIWKLDTLPKIQTFLWKCFLHRIPLRILQRFEVLREMLSAKFFMMTENL